MAIFKKDEKCKVENYCPVTLTSQLSKVLESIIKDEITSHLRKHILIRGFQHGFMPKRSCLINLLLFLEEITAQVDKGHPVDIIYMDLVRPSIRCRTECFLSYGIVPKLIKWIEAWLYNRKQRVVLKGKHGKLSSLAYHNGRYSE